MRKTILTGMVLILMLFLLPSCAAGISQEEYDRASSDLAAAQTQIQSLQGDLTGAQAQIQSLQGDLTGAQAQVQSLQGDLDKAQAQIQSLQSGAEAAEKKPAEALAYAEYFDVIMYPVWRDAGLTPRFVFESDFEWMLELRNRASDMGDTELTTYVKRLEKRDDAAMTELWYYCLDRIEKALK